MFEFLMAGSLIGLTHAMPPGPITIEVPWRGAVDGTVSAMKVNAGSVVADVICFMICITSPFAVMWWASIFAGSTALILPGYDTMTLIFAG